jgi:hypothetical protein
MRGSTQNVYSNVIDWHTASISQTQSVISAMSEFEVLHSKANQSTIDPFVGLMPTVQFTVERSRVYVSTN